MSAYETLLQQQPASADTRQSAAQGFVNVLTLAIESGQVFATFSTAQQNYVYKLRAKWQLRAAGEDADWSTRGRARGRKPRPTATLDPTVFGAESDIDPLLASLSRKYGTPRRTDEI